MGNNQDQGRDPNISPPPRGTVILTLTIFEEGTVDLNCPTLPAELAAKLIMSSFIDLLFKQFGKKSPIINPFRG